MNKGHFIGSAALSGCQRSKNAMENDHYKPSFPERLSSSQRVLHVLVQSLAIMLL